jgi:hypothetical protein
MPIGDMILAANIILFMLSCCITVAYEGKDRELEKIWEGISLFLALWWAGICILIIVGLMKAVGFIITTGTRLVVSTFRFIFNYINFKRLK